ncbi:dephospho-CoA kinase [Candidatus Enterococcus clewellii]|uniref:Dephospho-CoA kinase n=1 Tax=Candidatus Enterococcus clewellii TaxID=1834193 RepID=A0A242KDJ1_9ENTE|nr:dephospho-CoA kinase [Enterococcus sp. 9E7_DIV0242]OTP19139.1 dephospho-CoA kinase [Enterococcus sp. 9E7_DIV0242]
MTLILGVTGSIATGKSTAVEVFRKAGYPIVDSDQIARRVVEPGTPGLQAIVNVFGEEMLNSDGSLNRKALGKLIFSDEKQREKLNQLLAPFLEEAIIGDIQLATKESDLVIADIPLLYEQGYECHVDQVAVVYIPESLQVKRLMKRDALTEAEAIQRVKSQESIELKKAKADVVFDNQGTMVQLENQVHDWLKKKK